ncbi:BadF/BadG/BcrA/BcrD ATPase family protein [Streptomyces sp. NPDC047042]|uniref:BadF/BadG/BcrA/BcrD ATPase family protein n=1 Tax=Streptomyces sp. NPDC047042 TaxID=3154807 RepID=UPI0033FBA2AC
MSNELNQDLARGSDRALVVGIDAGGTRTRALLASAADGSPLGEGVAGPGNALTVPVPQLTEHLVEALAKAVPESVRSLVVAVAGGFAGAAGTADEPGRVNARTALTQALRRLGIPAREIRISSDIEAAFAAAPGAPADGLALVAGTGAVAMRITARHCEKTVGGDGWLLGDDGGGFWIGREAVRVALRMADRRGPDTTLAALVGRELGVPDAVLPPYGRGASAYGGGASACRGGRSAREDGGSAYEDGGSAYEVEASAYEGEASAREVEASAYEGEASAREGEASAYEGEASAQEGEASAYEGEASAQEGEASAYEGEASAYGDEGGLGRLWSRDAREAYRRHVLPAVMSEPPVRLARFAPLVAGAARAGDLLARAILDEAAGHLADCVRALRPQPGETVVATGGLLGPEGPLTDPLDPHLRALGLVAHWVPDGSRGAVALARVAHDGSRDGVTSAPAPEENQ